MCFDRSKDDIGSLNVGYKVFKIDKRRNLHFKFEGVGRVPVGKWINEKDYRPRLCIDIIIGSQSEYPTGFHAYVDEVVAWKHCGKMQVVKRLN